MPSDPERVKDKRAAQVLVRSMPELLQRVREIRGKTSPRITPPTRRNLQILRFVYDYTSKNLRSPSYREIGLALGGINYSTVFSHIARLRMGGLLEHPIGSPRSLHVTPEGLAALGKPALELDKDAVHRERDLYAEALALYHERGTCVGCNECAWCRAKDAITSWSGYAAWREAYEAQPIEEEDDENPRS